MHVFGRIAALLELGAGFNLDFTGKENVYLNAAMLGMGREEVARRFSSIVDFADIGSFIDQPVRTYSSGMFVRLAFAVAISADPDILVIDEALSVGDEVFQRKCFSRIEDLKKGGATILFVSHSAGSVLQLCDRAMLLDRGTRLLTGTPKHVVAMYQRLAYAPENLRASIIDEIRDMDAVGNGMCARAEEISGNEVDRLSIHVPTVVMNSQDSIERFDPGLIPDSTVEYVSNGAVIENPVLLNSEGKQVNVLAAGYSYTYTYEVRFTRDSRRVHFGMMVKSVNGIEIAGMASHAHGDAEELIPAGSVVRVKFGLKAVMVPGTYFLNAGCMGSIDGGETYLHRLLDVIAFRIEIPKSDRRISGFFDISVEPACEWSICAE